MEFNYLYCVTVHFIKAVSLMKNLDKYKPAVTGTVLLVIAGIVWQLVGIWLLYLAFCWLHLESTLVFYRNSAIGVVSALLIHHLGFLKIVSRNTKRISQMDGKRCVFSFIPWKSYLTIFIMVMMGVFLRHSTIPKKYLAVLYIGIGLALILSSIRYLRIFIKERRRGG